MIKEVDVSLESTLAGWTGPSSATEQDRQDRTVRMIKAAIAAHPGFDDVAVSVYAKGSYPNNTNVRTDSDVDVVVQCSEVVYWEEHVVGGHDASGTVASPYVGPWTPSKLRTEVVAALEAQFGDQVDASGTTAVRVRSSSARVEADVVPSFDYHYYFEDGSYREGTKVFRKNGDGFENFPAQHLAEGRAKNSATNTRFKQAVRILKRVENAMVADGAHREVPSFLVECLVFNSPNTDFTAVNWTNRIRNILVNIWEQTQGNVEPEDGRWLEVNRCKWLFHPTQAWSRRDAREFAGAAWNYLGYES